MRVTKCMATCGPLISWSMSPTGDVILVKDDLGYSRANIMVVDFDWADDVGKCLPC